MHRKRRRPQCGLWRPLLTLTTRHASSVRPSVAVVVRDDDDIAAAPSAVCSLNMTEGTFDERRRGRSSLSLQVSLTLVSLSIDQ